MSMSTLWSARKPSSQQNVTHCNYSIVQENIMIDSIVNLSLDKQGLKELKIKCYPGKLPGQHRSIGQEKAPWEREHTY
jgi:hypothetical protein